MLGRHFSRLGFLVLSVSIVFSFKFGHKIRTTNKQSFFVPAMDRFILEKMDHLQRNFDALTERINDPDVAGDRKQLLQVSKERSMLEPSVIAYREWRDLEAEKLSLAELSIQEDEPELKEIIRTDLKELSSKQLELEESISVMLLPKDPNDDRNVMLEVRSGAGGDEACIWAGDLVSIYRKYCELLGWKVSIISESHGECGGYKTCILQVTGDHVYSKMKFEVLL
jgi:peptide chain release factor 1